MAGFEMQGTPILVQDGTNIDRRQCRRIVPMKVLVLGLCRTGTMSVRTALRSLGYLETYHMRAASTETPRDCELWMQAIKAKWDGEGKFDKEDWDQLLGHCQAVCDLPAAAFAPELIAAYPNAKVILTTRDPESWHKSTSKTIYQGITDPTSQVISHFDWAFSLYRPMLVTLWDRLFEGDFENRGVEVFKRHYDLVRELVPPERLLEYDVGDGWGPLCEFLGEDRPAAPFPYTNTISDFQHGLRGRNNRKIRNAIFKAVILVLGMACIWMSFGYISKWTHVI
ncbi:hypothetical protein N8I77_007123 [Diaporthe amygdali]|uniref:NAD dependent epimerase/dehydratase n=1 Tax=Phomopsis amygdali TaxID=1214568 RepID=A0AAD9SBE3_PHOAM|nr:uncharacterized protein J7T55_007902 [Diaporthe amygdali]KAJ0114068.1 hypothetical protein J7T55_007902 [Diaporthe amygdali]KAK2604172.1 hypothetical protein N8I77_007123 [Diaporthe amygdali]